MSVSAGERGSSAAAVGIGDRLGRYVLCRELGVGGMASVYLARIEGVAGFEKLVALKTIHPHLAREQTFVDMFLDEARLASKIDHRNVCSVFDFGEQDGTYYLAMEYLVGEPLLHVTEALMRKRQRDLLDGWPLLAARLIADACEGLHAAHELVGPDGTPQHVVHRDVSPHNLFVTFDGTVKVVDFGCAKAAERISHTDTGVLKGKVSYAAPEQMRMQGVDRRADVWALGVCLWEMLTFSRLFSRDTQVATAMAVLEDPIPQASEGRKWVPPDLAAIASRALQRDPEQRYPTARHLARDLRQWIARSGHSIEAAEVAEWMDRLFAGGRERQLHLLEELRTEPATRIGAQGSTRRSVPTASAEDLDPGSERRWTRGHGRFSGALAAVVLAALGGVAGWGWQTGRLDGWIASASAATGLAAAQDDAAGAGAAQDDAAGAGAAQDDAAGASAAATSVAASPEPTSGAPLAFGPAPGDDGREWRDVPPASAQPSGEPARAQPSDEPSRAAREPQRERTGRTDRERRRRGRARRAATRGTTAAGSSDEEPAAPEATAETGSVHIVADGGWAEVFQGARFRGTTPVTLELEPGPHALTLVPFGDAPPSEHRVRVHAGTEVTVRISVGDDEG